MCLACSLLHRRSAAPSRRGLLRASAGLAAAPLLAEALPSFGPAQAATPAPPVVIIAGNLWDGMADAPQGPAEILVDNGRIAAIGPSVGRPPGAQVVALPGRTVTPCSVAPAIPNRPTRQRC